MLGLFLSPKFWAATSWLLSNFATALAESRGDYMGARLDHKRVVPLLAAAYHCFRN